MLAVFKRLTNNKGKRRLFENFLSLSGLKVFTYILPLVTLPYLVRVLGVEKYGLVVFAQSFIMFFNVLVDYGFNLSATREISINRGDKNKITEIYSSVLTIKMVLLVLSFGVLWSLVVTVDRLAQDAGLYLLTFLMVVGQALFPIWYFQGVERMKYITIVNILSRAAFALAVFVFVRHEDQYILVPLLNGLGVCFGSAYALFLVKTKFGQTFVWQGFDKVSLHFKDSTQFFLSRIGASVYTSANVFILGLVTSNVMVGYYSVAERLYNAIHGLYGPVAQALYPYIAKERSVGLFKKIFVFVFVLNFVGVCFLFFANNFIFYFLFGSGFGQESVRVFNILLVASLIVVPSIMIGHPLLGALGYVRYANVSVLLASAFHVLLLTVLYVSGNISIYSVSVLIVFTELVNLGYRMYGVKVSKVLRLRS